MTVDYGSETGVRLDIKTSSGGAIESHFNQSGERTYAVLKNSYDLVFTKGLDTVVVDDLDCTSDCAVGTLSIP